MNNGLQDFGKFLLQHNLPITVLYNYDKGSKQLGWPRFTKHQMSVSLKSNITGLGIIIGRDLFDHPDLAMGAIDIDIYDSDLSEHAKNHINQFFADINKPVYLETTPSGGIHFFFYYHPDKNCGHTISNIKYAIYNKSCRIKDGKLKAHAIELFFENKQVVIAPSKAKDKFTNQIREYRQLSDINIANTCVLTHTEIEDLKRLCSSFQDIHNEKEFECKYSKSIHVGIGKNGVQVYDNKIYARRCRELNKYNRSVTHLDKLIKENLSLEEMLKTFKINGKIKNSSEVLIYSLAENDGDNPGCIIYDNEIKNNTKQDYYFVFDTYICYKGSLSRYLICYANEHIWANVLSFAANYPLNTRISLNPYDVSKTLFGIDSQYIPGKVSDDILKIINDTLSKHPDKIPTILICAPTGIGKTTLFYDYAIRNKLKLLIALAYRSQVEQGKQQYKHSTNLIGLCHKDQYVHSPNSSFFMTYDKTRYFNGQSGNNGFDPGKSKNRGQVDYT